MPQGVRQRQQTTVNYSSNNKVAENLSRGMIFRELYLNLEGAPTMTAGNNTAANTMPGDEWGCVKEIRIVANGTNVIRSISGEQLRMLNFFNYGTPGRRTTTLGDGATANAAFSSTLILPLWMPRSIRPMDTALDSRQLSSLTVEIQWGTFTDINSAATAWTTEPTISVRSLESFGINGPFATWRFWEIEKEITATNSRFQIQLPVGGVYRGFMLHFTDAGVDDSAVLNNMKLISGSTVFADVSAEVLQDQYWIRNGNQRTFTGAAFDDLFISDDSNWGGWYMYDHVTDGFLTEGIDTLGFSELVLELDVTVGGGTTKAIVTPQEIIPVRGNPGN